MTDLCPECGTPVWSREPTQSMHKDSQAAMIWGIVAIGLFFMCLGPLAGLVAIPALVYGHRAKRAVRAGLVPPGAASAATAGLVCAWITIVLSVLMAGLWVLMFIGGTITF